MFDTPEKRKVLRKWVIGTFTCCVLIYLGMRHITPIVQTLAWFMDLTKALWLGGMLALILNVPLRLWERLLNHCTRLRKAARPLAICLALVSVGGIFAGVLLLVLPELTSAIRLLAQIIGNSLETLAQMEPNPALAGTPVEAVLLQLDIDWAHLQTQLEEWFRQQSGAVVEQLVNATKTIVSSTVTFFVSLIFAIYILSAKEKLKRQCCRLLRVWLPQKASETIIHVSAVCNAVFRNFVAGQTLEAIILGSLCMAGMLLLRIPYAPMVGALVGVTALIPIVGAFVGTIVGALMILTVAPFKALLFVVFLLILQQVEGDLIYPRVVGAKLNLPAIWVLAAVTIGGNLAGPLGMLLGVPAASAAYALLREATQKREQAKQSLTG